MVNEGESKQVQAIFQKYLETESLLATAQWLNKRGWINKRFETFKGNPTQFANVVYDPFYAAHGISFNLSYNNTSGVGSLTLQAVPEPGTMGLLALGAMALLRRRKLK